MDVRFAQARRRRDLTGPVVSTVGVVLAGGRSRRMGGADKCLLRLGAKPIIAHVLERFAGQTERLIISANGHPGRFDASGIPVVPDPIEGFAGPLAGILAGMLWAQSQSAEASHLVTVAADTPFIPTDLSTRLVRSVDDDETIAIASSGGRVHPVFGLWPLSLRHDLETWLADGRNRAVHAWIEIHGYRTVDFAGPNDPFFNVNTPADLAAAEARFRQGAK